MTFGNVLITLATTYIIAKIGRISIKTTALRNMR